MKKLLNAKTKDSATRDLFAELREGIEALAEERTRKRPLRTHAVEVRDAIKSMLEGGEAALNLRKERSGF